VLHFKKSSPIKNKKGGEEGARERERNGNATQNRNIFPPQVFLYEAGAGKCGKEGGYFRNFPMGREKSLSF